MWVLKQEEETGKKNRDDAAWHFLPKWGLADHNKAVFAMCMCASPKVGGFQSGHGKVELLFGVVRALCINTQWN